jgi:hypothetical protein
MKLSGAGLLIKSLESNDVGFMLILGHHIQGGSVNG